MNVFSNPAHALSLSLSSLEWRAWTFPSLLTATSAGKEMRCPNNNSLNYIHSYMTNAICKISRPVQCQFRTADWTSHVTFVLKLL